MIGMKNVDETEEEDIPEEVLNNITNKQEKLTNTPEVEEIKEIKVRPKGGDDYFTKKNRIKLLFIIFAIINNAFPFVTSIIEIILRAVNDYPFSGILIAEICFYVIIVLCFIKLFLCPGKGTASCEVGCGALAASILVLYVFLGQITSCLFGGDYSKGIDGFTLSFYKFRVYGIIVIICNDIILACINCNIRLF